ncbi:MAG: type II toxin-antitoxin system VapC family toxin [Fidelibacterota bacterium]
MNYLLDTCIISELIKNEPNKKVVSWIDSIDEMKLFLSVITIGEIEKGLSKLPKSKQKSLISEWLHEDLLTRFNNRIINLDIDTLFQWGKMYAALELKGLKMPSIDSLIAATAKQNNFCLVTRNIRDFENCSIVLFNPWK